MKIFLKLFLLLFVFILSIISSIGSEVTMKKTTGNSQFDNILILAMRAPSGHNTQPWTVKIKNQDEWIVGWDKSRALPGVDSGNRELMISIGAFCEAVRIAARSEGFQVTSEVIAKSNFDEQLVRLRLKKLNAVSTEDVDALNKRRTVRKGMESRILEKDVKTRIIRGTTLSIHYFDKGTEQAKIIEKAVLEANKVQVSRNDAQEELASWIRWSNKDAVTFRNGLTPAMMEIGGIAGWYVKHFYGKEDVLSKGFRDKSIDIVSEQLSSYGSWIVIETKGHSPAELIYAGRDFLRLGLNSYYEKIALHPMTQPIEEAGFENALKKDLGINGRIQWIIRAGHVKKYPEPVSLRMNLDRILLDAN